MIKDSDILQAADDLAGGLGQIIRYADYADDGGARFGEGVAMLRNGIDEALTLLIRSCRKSCPDGSWTITTVEV